MMKFWDGTTLMSKDTLGAGYTMERMPMDDYTLEIRTI